MAGPRPLVANASGEIVDLPGLRAAARAGDDLFALDPADLVPLPEASELLFLPARTPWAFDGEKRAAQDDSLAVAAFLPPGWTALALSAFRREPGAPLLPLYAYTAVCWHRGRICAAARRVDDDPKHDPQAFSRDEVKRRVTAWKRRLPENRLVRHHGERCALEWGCPNAQNLFLGRFEAPIALARSCNAACLGCISEQPAGTVPSPQTRLDFKPTLDEILELAVPHLERAPRAMVSFGQGCEGEPLLEAERIEQAIRAIRARTRRGSLHLNTNGSRPDALARLADAGLDSVRVSTNGACEETYAPYYRPRTYRFADVVESLRVARARGLFTSLNLLSFPGISDRADEAESLLELARETGLGMIQWRCLNVDPDWYMELYAGRPRAPRLGMRALLERIRQAAPNLRFGYFNPPADELASGA